MKSAPAASTAVTCAPSLRKSADSIDGPIMTGFITEECSPLASLRGLAAPAPAGRSYQRRHLVPRRREFQSVDLPHRDLRSRTTMAVGYPPRLWGGVTLLLVSWWLAWFGPAPFSEHVFFPLWLGYILAVDGLTARRSGTSLFSR